MICCIFWDSWIPGFLQSKIVERVSSRTPGFLHSLIIEGFYGIFDSSWDSLMSEFFVDYFWIPGIVNSKIIQRFRDSWITTLIQDSEIHGFV